MPKQETPEGSAQKRPRKPHAVRREETQARIKAAVIESISEVGYHRTTAAEIARRAGTSWGAVQYHFGDKDGILMAVLVDSFAALASELERGESNDLTLEKRIEAFVLAAWSHIRSPHYRSTFEILLNTPLENFEADGEFANARILETWDAIWQRFFPDARLSPGGRITLQYYVIATLSGLAAFRRFGTPSERRELKQLRFLRDTMLREFKAAL